MGSGSPADRPDDVGFQFDGVYPFAYPASLRMREVRAHTGTEVNWRFSSLEQVNRPEGRTSLEGSGG